MAARSWHSTESKHGSINSKTSRAVPPVPPTFRPYFTIHVSKLYDSRMHRCERQELHAPRTSLTGFLLARLYLSRLRKSCVKTEVVAICYNPHKLICSRLVSPSCPHAVLIRLQQTQAKRLSCPGIWCRVRFNLDTSCGEESAQCQVNEVFDGQPLSNDNSLRSWSRVEMTSRKRSEGFQSNRAETTKRAMPQKDRLTARATVSIWQWFLLRHVCLCAASL